MQLRAAVLCSTDYARVVDSTDASSSCASAGEGAGNVSGILISSPVSPAVPGGAGATQIIYRHRYKGNVMTVSTSIEQADRRGILDTLIGYSWAIDTGDAPGVADLFLPNGEFHGADGAVSKGREALEAFAARVHNSRPERLQHVTSSHQISVVEPGIVHVRSYVHIYVGEGTGPRLLGMGAYNDRLQSTEEGWRFESRRFENWGRPA